MRDRGANIERERSEPERDRDSEDMTYGFFYLHTVGFGSSMDWLFPQSVSDGTDVSALHCCRHANVFVKMHDLRVCCMCIVWRVVCLYVLCCNLAQCLSYYNYRLSITMNIWNWQRSMLRRWSM